MDAVGPSDILAEREQPDVIDDRLAAAAVRARVAGARARTQAAGSSRPQSVEQRPQFLPLGRIDHVVGIEPEGIIAGRPGQGRVPGRGEVVDPDEVEHPGAELRAISTVRSTLPVSTMTISSKTPRTDFKHCGKFFSSSRTIIVKEIFAADRGGRLFAADRRGRTPIGSRNKMRQVDFFIDISQRQTKTSLSFSDLRSSASIRGKNRCFASSSKSRSNRFGG